MRISSETNGVFSCFGTTESFSAVVLVTLVDIYIDAKCRWLEDDNRCQHVHKAQITFGFDIFVGNVLFQSIWLFSEFIFVANAILIYYI